MEAVQAHRWTREQYERLADADVFPPERRVELIDGEILEMSPQKRLHASAILLVGEALRDAFGPGFTIQAQLPLALGDDSLPEPDVAVVPGSPRDYRDHPSDARLVVEVADSSLSLVRGRKLRLYARSSVPEYWIVNLIDSSLEVYRDPAGEVYRSKSTYSAQDAVSPVARPESTVMVADLLP